MAQRTFTLQEAQVLLPVLKSLLKQAIDGKKLIQTIDAEFQALGQRIFLSGGLLVEIGKAATRRAERDKTVQRIKDVVAEIDATGVQVKDLDMGLLDFPCVVDGNTILLCWKMGEDKITHWHGVDEGYAGRNEESCWRFPLQWYRRRWTIKFHTTFGMTKLRSNLQHPIQCHSGPVLHVVSYANAIHHVAIDKIFQRPR